MLVQPKLRGGHFVCPPGLSLSVTCHFVAITMLFLSSGSSPASLTIPLTHQGVLYFADISIVFFFARRLLYLLDPPVWGSFPFDDHTATKTHSSQYDHVTAVAFAGGMVSHIVIPCTIELNVFNIILFFIRFVTEAHSPCWGPCYWMHYIWLYVILKHPIALQWRVLQLIIRIFLKNNFFLYY